ncbi:hypothetical protein HNQ51_001714 [Inhella inkyongensis]|uniref:Uncharacterized protein n=1 Tax=Inhella inkyongensis TaxID=392593 RepID=A0A840S7H3_9BURK|nr:hypothetical protein [Inhella inkyongensis]MBB5204400.1 hypothetical protein [Inhella inkyongensis]
MTITLSDGITLVDLPADLYWADELSWSAVTQTVEHSLTGALIVQFGTRQAGRPITLQPPEEGKSSWISRAALQQLQVWAQLPGQALTLTLRGLARQVIWRHQDGALEPRPVQHFADVAPDDAYTATLRFMEI